MTKTRKRLRAAANSPAPADIGDDANVRIYEGFPGVLGNVAIYF